MIKNKTTRSKSIVKKPTPKNKDTAKPIEVVVVPKTSSGWMDKVLDLVKWVDTPFKLITVIILGVVGLVGYIVYKQQDLIIENITSKNNMTTLLVDEKLSSLSRELLRNSGAETVFVHQVNLPQNMRITRIVQSHDGRFTPLEGIKGAFFSNSPERNKAAVSMLNGEILCEPFVASSSVGDWSVARGVTYTCRGSIPPEVGHMIGYIAVGFKKEPRDIMSVKALINQTAHDMAH